MSITISPVVDASGRVVGASSVARDVTERKRAEAKFYLPSASAKRGGLRGVERALPASGRAFTVIQLGRVPEAHARGVDELVLELGASFDDQPLAAKLAVHINAHPKSQIL